MKKIIITLLFISTQLLAFCQADKASVQAAMDDLMKQTDAQNFRAVIDFLHPAVLETIPFPPEIEDPKQAMADMMTKQFNDPTIKLGFKDREVLNITDIMQEKEGNYALIDHKFTMLMTMVPTEDTDEAREETRSAAKFTKEIFEAQYGKENVAFDEEKITFEIKVTSKTVAIDDEKTEGWALMEIKPQYEEVFKAILPKKVFKQLEF